MVRALLAMMLTGASVAADAADDLKIAQLEQDVRDLQRQTRAMSQQIEELRAQLRGAQAPRVAEAPAPTLEAGVASPALWLDASKWKQLHTGMSELEVIGALGPPTSMRATGEERVLLYALEIGTSGFLAGSVTLRDRSVTEVQAPVLK